MTIKEIKQKLAEYQELAEEISNEIVELEEDIEIKKEELDFYEKKIDELETEKYEHFLSSATKEEWIEYFMETNERDDIQGQFCNNDKWYICNGYMMIEFDNKLENVAEVEWEKTLINAMSEFEKMTDSINIDINTRFNEGTRFNDELKISETESVSGHFLNMAKGIMGFDKETKFFFCREQKQFKIENKDCKAIILMIVQKKRGEINEY